MSDYIRESKYGAMALLLLFVLGFVGTMARCGDKIETPPEALSAQKSECADFESAEEVSARIDVELERWGFNAGMLINTGMNQYRDEMSDSVKQMKGLIETARRCKGFSDTDLGLRPDIIEIIGIEPKPKREKP